MNSTVWPFPYQRVYYPETFISAWDGFYCWWIYGWCYLLHLLHICKKYQLMLNIWWIKILSLQLNITSGLTKSGEVGDLFTLILIKITLLSLGHIVEVLDTLVKFCMLAVFCMSLWICIEEFLFKVLCEFVWRNSCSMYCVNFSGGILVQSIVWIGMEKFLFKVLCEFVRRNSCSMYCVNFSGGILVQSIVWICMEEFFFKVLCEFFWRNSC